MSNIQEMEIYLVGGAVRDELLGQTPNDFDYVVVGQTVQSMLDAGFVQVGKHFPVFLDEDGDEYALARTEKSTGNGYNDFSFEVENVTLEQDLERRDLTINAIAKNTKTGEYIDPMGGRKDLEDGILRHCSDAFKEDPIRLLRLCRFSAQFSNFNIDNKTIEIVNEMNQDGLFDDLDANRIKREIHKSLLCEDSTMFFIVLHSLRLVDKVHKSLSENVQSICLDCVPMDNGFNDDTQRMLKVVSLLSEIDISYDEFMTYGEIFKKKHVKFAYRVNQTSGDLLFVDEYNRLEMATKHYQFFIDNKMHTTEHLEIYKVILRDIFYYSDEALEDLEKYWVLYQDSIHILSDIDFSRINEIKEPDEDIKAYKARILIDNMVTLEIKNS